MIEPLDNVYVSRRRRHGSYHRGTRRFLPQERMWTHCMKLALVDCDQLSEAEAVLTHEPCLRCFILRGRRQQILSQLAEADPEVSS